jgi:hypothetical protein
MLHTILYLLETVKYIDNNHSQFYRHTYNDKTPAAPEAILLFFQKELRS